MLLLSVIFFIFPFSKLLLFLSLFPFILLFHLHRRCLFIEIAFKNALDDPVEKHKIYSEASHRKLIKRHSQKIRKMGRNFTAELFFSLFDAPFGVQCPGNVLEVCLLLTLIKIRNRHSIHLDVCLFGFPGISGGFHYTYTEHRRGDCIQHSHDSFTTLLFRIDENILLKRDQNLVN